MHKAENSHKRTVNSGVWQVLSGNDQVILNVGGVSFTTTQTTLQNGPVPSLFAAMFSGRHTLRADQVDW